MQTSTLIKAGVVLLVLWLLLQWYRDLNWVAHGRNLDAVDSARMALCRQRLLGLDAPSIDDEPLQVGSQCPPFKAGAYNYKPLADFVMTARVLSTMRYTTDASAVVSPIDLAVGWGRMSEDSVLDKLSIRQSSRFFFWRTDDFPIPRSEIERSAANMHVIPGNDEVLRALERAGTDDQIRLWGFLVEVRGDDGFNWRSSTVRTDTGNGACEVIWVERVEI